MAATEKPEIERRPTMSAAPNPTGLDAYKPSEIAQLIETAGVAKAALPLLSLVTLGVLAGAFISLGAMFYLQVLVGADPGYGLVRLAAGAAFSLGLILVIIGGAELFTGNALLVMALVDDLVSTRALAKNWLIIYCANFAGALTMVALCWLAGLEHGAVGAVAAKIAAAKAALPPVELLARGTLCNLLVCLAVWLSFAAHDAASKVLVIIPPIAAFVALGFEHSVANMFLLPFGMLSGAAIGWSDVANNLLWVTLGNLIGGGGGVALTYWAAYRAHGNRRRDLPKRD